MGDQDAMANIVPMVIDSHRHAGVGFGLTDPSSGRPLLEKYLRRAASAGITHTVLFANFHEDYGRPIGLSPALSIAIPCVSTASPTSMRSGIMAIFTAWYEPP